MSSQSSTDRTEKLLHNWRKEAESQEASLAKSKLKWTMAFLSPDPFYDWSKVNERSVRDNDGNERSVIKADTNLKKIQNRSMRKNWVKLSILPNRKLSVDGNIVEGVLMPFEKYAWILIGKEIANWFSTCLEHDKNDSLKINESCFVQRQKHLLAMFLKSQSFYSKLYFSIYKMGNF